VTTATAGPGLAGRLRRGAVYGGGLLGPLGGGMVAAMLPEVAASLHTTRDAVAGSVTTYFVPFAALQLVSGTLGERWGLRRTVRVAYVAYFAASLACCLAPTLPVFLVARAFQGAANAFTSPLLLAGLAGLIPAEGFGRAVGVYSSCQAAGQSLALLLGGAAAEFDWRWAFVAAAGWAGLLAFAPPPGDPRPGASAPPWRPLLTVPMALLGIAAFVSYFGAAGLPFLVSLRARDALHLSAGTAGLVLTGFGVAGLVLGPVWGRVVDRRGGRRTGAVGALAVAAFIALLAVATTPLTFTACWVAAGAAMSLLTVALQSLTAAAVPTNRGGAFSLVSAYRFTGSAVAPAAWLPLYRTAPAATFAIAGATVLTAIPCLTLDRRAKFDSSSRNTR
jgi:MFS family permease